MSFDALIQKVKQAEGALEAYERQGAADLRQFKSTWRAAWTPGRTVVAGLVSGFLVGRAQPLKHVDGGSVLRMFSAVSSVFAISRAQNAADDASHAADSAEDASAPTHADTQPPSASRNNPAAATRARPNQNPTGTLQ